MITSPSAPARRGIMVTGQIIGIHLLLAKSGKDISLLTALVAGNRGVLSLPGDEYSGWPWKPSIEDCQPR